MLLVVHTGYDWTDGFVGLGILVVVVGGALGMGFFAPAGERLAESHRSGDRIDVRRYLTMVGVDSALVVLAIVAMVDRWQA